MARARNGEQLLDAYDNELQNRYGVTLAEIGDIVEDSDIAWNDGDFIPARTRVESTRTTRTQRER